MFSTDFKIISVAGKESYTRDLIVSATPPIIDFKTINTALSFHDQSKYCGNHKFYQKCNTTSTKHGSSSNKSNCNKYAKKANKNHITNCERILLNNNNATSKNQNLTSTITRTKPPAGNITAIVNKTLNSDNSCNSNRYKLTPQRSTTKIFPSSANDRSICSAGRTEEDPMVMNNTPKTTQTLAVSTTSAPPSPASYTLDFLHSVGVQMTAGTNRAYTTSATPSRHTTFTSPANHRCGAGFSPADDLTSTITTNATCTPINSHTKSSYKDYNNYNAATVGPQSRNASLPIPSSPSFSYHTAYGYQPPRNYANHNARNYNSHIQYQHSGVPGNGGGGGNTGQHTFNGYNRNQMPKKGWGGGGGGGGLNQINIKKCCNVGMNKYGSVSSSNLNSPQNIPRTRSQQNLRNLTYVHTESSRMLGNSRSPTPSPKSESPSLYKSQNMQECGTLIQPCAIDQVGGLIATSAPSIDMNNTNGTMTGYESDSSHSSYRHNEFVYRPPSKNLTISPNFQLTEMPQLINFSALSEEDLKNHAHYYGSHQNLTFWNSGVNTTYSPHSLYSTSGSGSSEAGSQYLSEGNFPQKRSQSHSRSYRGRRNVYPNFRTHTFHENMFTPPDRFLARAHLIEIKESPDTLLNGSKWDSISQPIWDRFMAAQQREDTYRRKMYLWRYLYVTIKKAHPRYGLYLVGSTITGFGADSSDVDMCLVSRSNSAMDARMESVINLNQLKEYLASTGVFEQFNLIEAKVPILRFRDPSHNLEVDLNFNNCVGIRNTHLLHCYAQLDWRLRPLVLVIKLWAQYHDINNAKNMTISSYSLALMVIHFLQYAVEPPVLPCLHEMYPDKFHILLKSNDFGFVDLNEEIEPHTSQNTQTLGELFLQFLEYYSNFDYAQYAISIRTGTVLPIELCRQAKTSKNDIRQWKELCIEEPFDLTNTARSVYDGETFERIKAIFITSWKILQETLDINAVFSPIVTANLSQVPLNLTTSIS